jgi:hypothetical protein
VKLLLQKLLKLIQNKKLKFLIKLLMIEHQANGCNLAIARVDINYTNVTKRFSRKGSQRNPPLTQSVCSKKEKTAWSERILKQTESDVVWALRALSAIVNACALTTTLMTLERGSSRNKGNLILFALECSDATHILSHSERAALWRRQRRLWSWNVGFG